MQALMSRFNIDCRHLQSYKINKSAPSHCSGKMLRLRQVLVLSRDVARSTQFYREGLGLPLLRSSDSFAEFDTRAGVSLCIKQAQKCVNLRQFAAHSVVTARSHLLFH